MKNRTIFFVIGCCFVTALVAIKVTLSFIIPEVSAAPCECICKSTECSKQECEDFPEKCVDRIHEVLDQRDRCKQDLQAQKDNKYYTCMWDEDSIRNYGKPWHKLSTAELKEHELYKKDIKTAIERLQSILDGVEPYTEE